ncbi:MAG: hypothetical protein F7C38_04905 [Desulfurococcales archaeon]|nr:hypothetical protein [Desulfurococcales archaeon]
MPRFTTTLRKPGLTYALLLLLAGIVILALGISLESRLSNAFLGIGTALVSSGAIMTAQSLAQLEIQEALESRREHKLKLNELAGRILEGDETRSFLKNGLEGTEFDVFSTRPCQALEGFKGYNYILLEDLDNHLEGKPVKKLQEICETLEVQTSSLRREVDKVSLNLVEPILLKLSSRYTELEANRDGLRGFIGHLIEYAVKNMHYKQLAWTPEILLEEVLRQMVEAMESLGLRINKVIKQNKEHVEIRIGVYALGHVEALQATRESLQEALREILEKTLRQEIPKHAKSLVSKAEESSKTVRKAEQIRQELVRQLRELKAKTYLPGICSYIK